MGFDYLSMPYSQINQWLSGKLCYLQHNCVGDTIVYHWDSETMCKWFHWFYVENKLRRPGAFSYHDDMMIGSLVTNGNTAIDWKAGHSLHAFQPMTAEVISRTKRKTAVTPLLTHWSYCCLALSHRFIFKAELPFGQVLATPSHNFSTTQPTWLFWYQGLILSVRKMEKPFSQNGNFC